MRSRIATAIVAAAVALLVAAPGSAVPGMRIKLKRYGAVLFAGADGSCRFERSGTLHADAATICTVRGFGETQVVDVHGFDVGEYALSVVEDAQAEGATGRHSYNVQVMSRPSVRLVVRYPPLGYLFDPERHVVPFAVEVVGLPPGRAAEVAVIEVDEATEHLPVPLKRQGQLPVFTGEVQPSDLCGNHRFLVRATWRGRSGEEESRFEPVDLEVSADGCKKGGATGPGAAFQVVSVPFGLDSASLDDPALTDQTNAIDVLARLLQRRTGGKNYIAIVSGFASSESKAVKHQENNLDLSRRRADEVAAAVRKSAANVDVRYCAGFGDQWPLASNLAESGRSRNRRAEIMLVPEGHASLERLPACTPGTTVRRACCQSATR